VSSKLFCFAYTAYSNQGCSQYYCSVFHHQRSLLSAEGISSFPKGNFSCSPDCSLCSPKQIISYRRVYFVSRWTNIFFSKRNESFLEGNTSFPEGDYVTWERVYESVARSCTRSISRDPELYKSLGHHGRFTHVSDSGKAFLMKNLFTLSRNLAKTLFTKKHWPHCLNAVPDN